MDDKLFSCELKYVSWMGVVLSGMVALQFLAMWIIYFRVLTLGVDRY